MKDQLQDLHFRPLYKGENTPYDLLLLADPSIEVIDCYLKTAQIFVVEKGAKVVGTLVLLPLTTHAVEIKNVAVAEYLQGRGLGQFLIRSILEYLEQTPYTTVEIGTANSSIGQLYLYQKLGFEIKALKKNFFTDCYCEAIYENGIQAKHMIMLEKKIKK